MRVAYVSADPGVPVFGRKGCSVHVQEVLRAFRRSSASVELFAARVDGAPPTGLEDLRVHHLPQSNAREIAARERASFRANAIAESVLERGGPFDLVYERYSLWSFAGMEYARASATPGLLEVNAPLIEEQARHRGLVHRAAAERVARRAFSAASAIVAVSEEVAARVAVYADGTPIHVVPNGVDVERFRPEVPETCPAAPDTFTVGFVGSLKPWHGLTLLVRAFERLARQHENVRLLVVGDGPGLPLLRGELGDRNLLEMSQLTGAVAPDDVPALLASMTVAVAPYERDGDFYFSPLKVFEYMATGLPIVATAIGQLAGIIEHGVTGLLSPPADPDALAAALDRLYHDAGLRAHLGRGARACAVRDHGWNSVCKRLLAIAGLQSREGITEALA